MNWQIVAENWQMFASGLATTIVLLLVLRPGLN
jgi:hypothetical protein